MPWVSPTWGPLSTRQMMVHACEWIRRQGLPAAGTDVEIAVGTDGYVLAGVNRTRFDSILMVRHPGHGGIYFWRGFEFPRDMPLEEKLLLETEISIIIGKYLLPFLPKGEPLAKRFSLHLDISARSDNASHRMLSLCEGWCNALGFATHIKPHAFAASKVADSYNRGGAKRYRLDSTQNLEARITAYLQHEDRMLDHTAAWQGA